MNIHLTYLISGGSREILKTPEQHRVATRKKQVELNPQVTHDILLSLRTGGM